MKSCRNSRYFTHQSSAIRVTNGDSWFETGKGRGWKRGRRKRKGRRDEGKNPLIIFCKSRHLCKAFCTLTRMDSERRCFNAVSRGLEHLYPACYGVWRRSRWLVLQHIGCPFAAHLSRVRRTAGAPDEARRRRQRDAALHSLHDGGQRAWRLPLEGRRRRHRRTAVAESGELVWRRQPGVWRRRTCASQWDDGHLSERRLVVEWLTAQVQTALHWSHVVTVRIVCACTQQRLSNFLYKKLANKEQFITKRL